MPRPEESANIVDHSGNAVRPNVMWWPERSFTFSPQHSRTRVTLDINGIALYMTREAALSLAREIHDAASR